MLKKDYCVLGAALLCVGAFVLTPGALDGFSAVTKAYPYLSSFIKFAVLATFGECIGLRIVAGVYNRPGFGVLPRALVWGCFGLGIKAAFTVFVAGMPVVLRECGLDVPADALSGASFGWALTAAFAVSVGLNLVFAPVMMTLHKVTDAHITATGGTLGGFFRPIEMTRHLSAINWSQLWGFVLKKTIPFFWIPMHALTFMLPQDFRIVFAALLGVVLGVILAFAARPKKA